MSSEEQQVQEFVDACEVASLSELSALLRSAPRECAPRSLGIALYNLAIATYNQRNHSRFACFVEHMPDEWVPDTRLDSWLLIGAMSCINSENPSMARYRPIVDRFVDRFVEPWLQQNPRRPPRPRRRDRARVMFFGESVRQTMLYQSSVSATAQAIDRSRFEVIGGVLHNQEVSPEIRSCYDGFFVFSDELTAITELRALSVDILVFFDGVSVTLPWRLLASHVARYQVFAAHLFSIGGGMVDAFFGDQYLIPQDKRQTYHAPIVDVAEHWQLFTSADCSAVCAEPPSVALGYTTIGSFGRPSKCDSTCLTTWSQVLKNLPQSRLIWINDLFAYDWQKQRVQTAFKENGVQLDRVQLDWIDSRADYLASFAEIDFTLETFPFSGGITTHTTLSSGLPTIAMAGRDFVERMSSVMMRLVGLDDCIAESPEHYVEKAVALAQNTDRLRDLRRELPARVAAAPFTDAATYGRNFSNALEAVLRMPPTASR